MKKFGGGGATGAAQGSILKFADDTKVFVRVSNSAQRQLLQDDLQVVRVGRQLADGV